MSSVGILEILYTTGTISSNPVFSGFGYEFDKEHTGLALWSEDTQTVVPFPLPPNIIGPKLSSDRRWILFRRDVGANQSDLLVISADGKNEKKMGSAILTDETQAQYSAGFVSLKYDWLPHTNIFFYEIETSLGEDGALTIEKFYLVDADSGKAISVKIPEDMKTYHFAPDGSQMTILTPTGLYVLSTLTGREEFKIQALLNGPTYSPDGSYLVDFVDGGILRVNTRDGTQQFMPLQYTIMSSRTEGPAYELLPDFIWIDNSTLLLISLNSDKRYVFALGPREPTWTFTAWEVDLAFGTTHQIQTFSGNPFLARISPDQNRLAFLKYQGEADSQTRELHMADLSTGKILATIPGGVFKDWFPDSDKYLYATGIPYPPPGKGDPGTVAPVINYYLGQVGREPILVNWDASGSEGTWLWVDQNRPVVNCKILTFP